jgi:radical SAM protein with 4Fe4S-binding SPASM domain
VAVFLNNKKFAQRARLGGRYLSKYLMDGLLGAYNLNRSPLKPLDILCEITYACNLRCPTCFRWTSKPDEDELSLEDWKGLIGELKGWLGTFNLSFGGGEPFLREDLIDIIKFAYEKGILVTTVSNGSLIDKALAKKIISSGLDALSLSLNSLNPEIHNRTRGTEASFDEAKRAIENLKNRGDMRLTLSTTVMSENIRELPGIVELVRSDGLDGINFQPLMEAGTFPVYNREGETKKFQEGSLYKELGREKGHIDEVFTRLIEMKKEGYPVNNSIKHLRAMGKYLKDPENPEVLGIPCKIGSKNFFIDPFGNVRICSIMDPIGNIENEDPRNIWNSEKARTQRENIRNCGKACRLLNCNFKELDFSWRLGRIVGS